MQINNHHLSVRSVEEEISVQVCGANPYSVNFVRNASEEEVNINTETHITRVGKTTRTFLGVKIKISAENKTNIGLKAIPMLPTTGSTGATKTTIWKHKYGRDAKEDYV